MTQRPLGQTGGIPGQPNPASFGGQGLVNATLNDQSVLFPQAGGMGGTGQLGQARVPTIADILAEVARAQAMQQPQAPMGPVPGTVPGQAYPGGSPSPDYFRYGPNSMFLGRQGNIAPQGLGFVSPFARR